MIKVVRRLPDAGAPRRGAGAHRPALAIALGLLLLVTWEPAARGQEGPGGGDCPPPTPLAGEAMTPPERARATATAMAGGAEVAAAACPTEAAMSSAPSGAASELAPELPPPDLPTANLQGYRFRLDATLTADLGVVPKEAPVYELERTTPSAPELARLAVRLGIEGPVEQRGEGSFTASGNGQLFASPDLVQYLSPVALDSTDVPTDDEALAAAADWLARSALVPDAIGEGRVVSRGEAAGRVVVLFGPEEPAPLLAAYPSVTVTIGAGGAVLEASARWARIGDSELYRLRDVEDAWFDVEASRAYLEADFGGTEPRPGSDITGDVAYADIGLAYTSAGAPGERQYLQPVYVFTGSLIPDGADQASPIKAYVPALVSAGEPIGGLADTRPRS